MAPFFGRYPLPLTSLIASCTSLHSSLCRHNRPAKSKIGTGVVRTLPPPRSAILATVRPSTRPSSYSPRPKTWPPGGNPVVGSLPVGCARARNRIFSGLNFPHTQTVLLEGTSNNPRFRRCLSWLSGRLQHLCRGESPIGDRFDAWPASARSFARCHTDSTRERTQAGAAAIRSS